MKLIVDFLLIGGIVINVIILLILVKSKSKELPQRILMFFFGIILLYIIHAYAETHKIKILYVATFIFNDFIEIFIGPLVYLYIKSLFEKNKNLVKKHLKHFIPVTLYIAVVSLPVLISVINRGFIFNYLEFLNTYSNLIFATFMLYLIIYIVMSIRLFYKYRKAMEGNFSNILEENFGWVKQMLIGTLCVSIFDLSLTLYELFSGELDFDSNYLTLISVVILLAYLGYYGVKQTKILLPDFLLQDTNKQITSAKNHKTLLLENKEFENYKARLLKVMEKKKVFLDEDLTLNKLAQQIEVTDKKLSLLLNQYMDTTFYDFINTYRVASVKEKMTSKDFENITLLGIAYESGFKSKTSFNRIFKKETGVSPSEYKKGLK